jgi:hypothetical protein
MHKTRLKALWHDPDPPRQIVDVKSDNEFITAIHPTTSPAYENHPFTNTTQQSNSRLKIWREQMAFTSHSPPPTPPVPKARLRLKPDSKEMTAIEQVLRGVRDERQGIDDSSTVASLVDGSEMKKEMSIDTGRDNENIKLYSTECDMEFMFPRQTIGLSGVFLRRTRLDGFDGEIVVEETSAVMKMLGAWMSRDLEFEITIGMPYMRPSD